MTDYFNQHIPAGDLIRPWLMLGPFYEDLSAQVQGLTFCEKPGATVGLAAMAEIVAEARPLLTGSSAENDEAIFRGQAGVWGLVRRPEKYLSWGTYNISNHLGAAFFSTVITPDEAGVRRWRVMGIMSGQVVVALNGTVVFENDATQFEKTFGIRFYEFEAALQSGENVLSVGVFRLARMAQVGFRLEVDTGVQARVALGMPEDERRQIEDSVRSVRLRRDVFYEHHAVGFTLGEAPGAGGIRAELATHAGEFVREVTATDAGEVVVCQGADVPDGEYEMRCTWLDAAGAAVTGTTYDIRLVTAAPVITGYERMAERRRLALEHFTGDVEGDRPIWSPVATYALGRYDAVDESLIRKTCEFIAARKDCADFAIQGVLRLMYWERQQQRLSPEINALMKDTILGFKYWVDEPGDTVMYMGSENHRLLFHVAEWMAGQLFPTEEFTNSRERGLYHATKGRMYITEWLRQRGRFGFDEWHSNAYFPICISPLLNVYDFAIYEDSKLQQMAGAVLDYMFFILAADSYKGVFGASHGRSYGIYIKYPDFEGTAATCWLLFGNAGMVKGPGGMSPVSIATSKYQLPKILYDIANDSTAVIDSKIRQGILPGTARHADFCVYRTPDYMLSGVQDHRKGEVEPSTHIAQVTLGNKALIFWSCPHTSGEGSGLRPDYWSGNTILPRVIQHKNVLALTWRQIAYTWITHCFLEPERFDEVRLDGNWAFVRVGGGYAGIYSEHGMVVGSDGQYAGRELQCAAPENTWLVECGREADWGSFDAFVAALKAAAITAEGDAFTYESPSIGAFVTGWDVVPTVQGEPIALRGYPMVESPWAYSRFGSGELAIRYGDEVYEIWFNQ